MKMTNDYNDEYTFDTDFDVDFDKLNALFSDSDNSMKAFTANVLIGNLPSKRLNECIGETFILAGFYCKETKFRDDKKGFLTTIFGKVNNEPCAYSTTSEKVLDALKKICVVFGKPDNWNDSVNVRIRKDDVQKSDGTSTTAYTLEVL